MFQVAVTNIGSFEFQTLPEAEECFQTYHNLSFEDYGKCAGETVILFDNNGDIIKEYIGTNDEEIEEMKFDRTEITGFCIILSTLIIGVYGLAKFLLNIV